MHELIVLLPTVFLSFGSARTGALKVCLVSGAPRYDSDASLTAFKTYLAANHHVRCRLIKARSVDDLPGLAHLDGCDVALFFTRRLKIDGEQLAAVKRYCEAGRPVVAVRTASHGFQNWLEFDKRVLGGNYHGHFPEGLSAKMSVRKEAKDHPILAGVATMCFRSSLYKTGPLAKDCTLLMSGSTPQSKGSHPVAWVREHRGRRVFYTSAGGTSDFQNATFRRMLANALFWTARRKVQAKTPPPPPQRPTPTGMLELRLRTRVQPFKGSDAWQEVASSRKVPVAETAILICDMWDEHWCKGATKRCDAIAAKMAAVIKQARAKGVQIVHAPSETMSFYADAPQRRRMMLAPQVRPPKLLDLPSHKLPIDDSDGGCDTDEKPWYQAWTRQNPRIDIGELDGISDSGTEVYNFFRQLGIKTMIIMGVHTNMCVLGRPFGIRRMTRLGIRCILVRDLTDAMYNPKMPPNVPHDVGTGLVVEHIEKHWCPSMTSEDLLAGLP